MNRSPGTLIRAARVQAQLSPTDVARRAGVAQSVICAYEKDRREPGARTLSRLVEVTGHRLSFALVQEEPRQRGLPDTRLGRRLRRLRRVGRRRGHA